MKRILALFVAVLFLLPYCTAFAETRTNTGENYSYASAEASSPSSTSAPCTYARAYSLHAGGRYIIAMKANGYMFAAQNEMLTAIHQDPYMDDSEYTYVPAVKIRLYGEYAQPDNAEKLIFTAEEYEDGFSLRAKDNKYLSIQFAEPLVIGDARASWKYDEAPITGTRVLNSMRANSTYRCSLTVGAAYAESPVAFSSESTGTPHEVCIFEELLSGESPEVAPQPVPVSGVFVNPYAFAVLVGKTVCPYAATLPFNADDKRVKFSIEDEKIATVSKNGAVTGVAVGETVLTVSDYSGKYSATAVITVMNEETEQVAFYDTAREKIELGKEFTVTLPCKEMRFTNNFGYSNGDYSVCYSLDMTKGQLARFSGSYEGTGGMHVKVYTKGDDGEYYFVNSGSSIYNYYGSVLNMRLYADRSGEYVFVFKLADEDALSTLKCVITENDNHVTGISLATHEVALKRYEHSEIIDVNIEPADAQEKDLYVTSSNEYVATAFTYANPQIGIRALHAGTAVITVTSRDGGFSDSLTVTVTERDVPAADGKLHCYLSTVNHKYSEWSMFNSDEGITLAENDGYGIDLCVSASEYCNGYLYTYTGALHSTGAGLIFSRADALTHEILDSADFYINNEIEKLKLPIDMSYCYANKTMYAVSYGPAKEDSSVLYEVNLETGELTEVSIIAKAVVAMTFDAKGRLLGMSEDGNLIQIDVESGMFTVLKRMVSEDMQIISGDFKSSMSCDISSNKIFWTSHIVAKDADSREEYSRVTVLDADTLAESRYDLEVNEKIYYCSASYIIQNDIQPQQIPAAEQLVPFEKALKLCAGMSFPVRAYTMPYTADGTFSVVSENPDVVSVDGKTIQTLKPGTARVILTAPNGLSADIKVTVEARPKAAEDGVVYAVRYSAYEHNCELISFNKGDPSFIYLVHEFDATLVSAEFVDGLIYAYTLDGRFCVYRSDNLELLCSLPVLRSAYDLTYDYTTKTMYATEYCQKTFCKVDLCTGKLQFINRLSQSSFDYDWYEGETFSSDSVTIAATPSGELYSVAVTDNSQAYLFRIDKETGESYLIGRLNVDDTVTINVYQSLTYDYETDTLLWVSRLYEPGVGIGNLKNCLYCVDIRTAETESLGPVGFKFDTVYGLFARSNKASDFEIGDANGDGVVNTGDAVLVLKNCVGTYKFKSYLREQAADFNRDGEVNTGDAVLILKRAVNE